MKKPILRSTLVAAMIAAIAGQASAAGLGRITVLSSLGQPLRAEVEVAATPEELETLSARLASPDSFKRANIEYAGSLTGIRMAVERRGASAIVRVTSDRAFNEPFVDMLIELNWAGGRLLREYTFLLDPSEADLRPLAGQPGPAVAAPVAPAPSVSAPRSTATPAPRSTATPAAAAPARRAAAAAPTAPVESRKLATDGEYEVQRGDSLSSIATDLKSEGVTQDQMLAALYQANTQAFTNGNINRLRAGRILSVPTAEDAKAIAPREARQIVLKASNFDVYRNQVAAAAEAGPAREASGSQSSSGQIAPKVQETAPAQASNQDKLKIAKTQVAPGAAATTDGKAAAGRIQSLEEDIASRDKALKEARSRVAELEKNIKGLQDLVKMKDENLANLQKQSAAAEKAAQDAQKKADSLAKSADAQKAAEAKKAAEDARKAAEDARKAAEDAKKAEAARLAEEQKAAESRKAAEAQRLADEQKAAEEAKATAELAATQAAAAAAVAVPAVSEPVAEVAPVEEVASAPAPAPQPAAQQPAPPPAPQPVVEEESSFPGGTLGMLLAAAALLGGGLLWRKKQQQNKNSSLNTTALTEASTSPNSVFGNAGGQTVDTGTSVLHTDFSQSGLSAIDTDEGVDPVAEADVYMAYGRDAQAEEILLDALKNDPSRTAIYVKLLEIYSQRRSVKQFENIATDLFTQTGGAGDDWAKAAALGTALDPENALYRTGATAAAPVSAPSVPTPVAAAAVAAAAAPLTIPDPLEEDAPSAVTFGTNNVSQMRATWTVPGEINQFTSDADGIPQISPEPVVSSQSAEPLNLDFNLDLELPDEDGPDTKMEARDSDDDILRPLDEQTVEVAADEAAPLEFDIGDLGGAKSLSSDSAMTRTLPEGIGALNAESLPASLTDADLGIERNLDDDGLAVVDLEKTNFEGNLLDFDFELGDEAKRGTAMPDRSVDLSNIDLRTDGNAQSTGGIAVPSSVTLAASEDVPDSIDLNEEVSTKLELARAYEEMGDLEGARELLEEVVTDGASQQKDQARQILARLG
ncbi:FimV/HubP family polar landmark protein [Uliginosibacterium sp. H1]|uniref:FimV/HubP family polar landmark protein n=1 Tax=Uliginosibacterium sp. H1 TaxID=3114757 RepID=UPI002E17AECE|nr:FimV/HubP family polar landmark protein [Uliginosibacterium sp. H1]